MKTIIFKGSDSELERLSLFMEHQNFSLEEVKPSEGNVILPIEFKRNEWREIETGGKTKSMFMRYSDVSATLKNDEKVECGEVATALGGTTILSLFKHADFEEFEIYVSPKIMWNAFMDYLDIEKYKISEPT